MSMQGSIGAARVSGPTRQQDGLVVFEFLFGVDDPTFAGHFPTRPLLPGVFLLEITRAAAQWTLAHSLVVREVCKAKFLRPILPTEMLRLEMKLSEADGALKVRALFSVDGTRAGDVLLVLARNP